MRHPQRQSPRRSRTPRLQQTALPLALVALAVVGSLTALAAAGDTASGATGPRVTAIDINLSFNPETGLILEQASLEVRGEGLRELTFDLNDGLVVERSSISQGFAEHRQSAGKLRLQLSPPLSGTATLKFRISGRPRRGSRELVGSSG